MYILIILLPGKVNISFVAHLGHTHSQPAFRGRKFVAFSISFPALHRAQTLCWLLATELCGVNIRINTIEIEMQLKYKYKHKHEYYKYKYKYKWSFVQSGQDFLLRPTHSSIIYSSL